MSAIVLTDNVFIYCCYHQHFVHRLTPLDYAVRNGHSECAEELKKNGAVSVATIREMAAICIQTVFRGFR